MNRTMTRITRLRPSVARPASRDERLLAAVQAERTADLRRRLMFEVAKFVGLAALLFACAIGTL